MKLASTIAWSASTPRYTDNKDNARYVALLSDGRQIQVVIDERVSPPHVITVID